MRPPNRCGPRVTFSSIRFSRFCGIGAPSAVLFFIESLLSPFDFWVASVLAFLLNRHGLRVSSIGTAGVPVLLLARLGLPVLFMESVRPPCDCRVNTVFALLLDRHGLRGAIYGIAIVSALLFDRYELRVSS